jgi:hypothetical protein
MAANALSSCMALITRGTAKKKIKWREQNEEMAVNFCWEYQTTLALSSRVKKKTLSSGQEHLEYKAQWSLCLELSVNLRKAQKYNLYFQSQPTLN